MNVPFVKLRDQWRAIEKGVNVRWERLASHQDWILGKEVSEFEKKVKTFLGTEFALGVGSGTDALLISLRAFSHKMSGRDYFHAEDEIILPSFTFTATGEAVLRSGARPIFADVHESSYLLDVEDVRKKITSRTRGILVVHLFGAPLEMEEFLQLAKKYDLFILEDCAQSFGAERKGRKTGAWGNAGAFSFFPTKILGGAGDGGMIVTHDEEIYEYCKILHVHGGKHKYDATTVGYNSRLDTFQAAILLEKLPHVSPWIKRRQERAGRYKLALNKSVLFPHNDNNHTYCLFTIRTKANRDELYDYLVAKGIGAGVYYKVPLHEMDVFKKFSTPLIVTEKIKNEVLSLPMDPFLTNEEIERVAQVLRDFQVSS